MNVLLFPHADRDKGLSVTNRVADMVRAHGDEPIIVKSPIDENGELPYEVFKRALGSASIIIAFGGDGTILRAARYVLGSDVPIIGVNMGGMGFMAEIEASQVEEVLPDILEGRYTVESRMMLDMELIRNGVTMLRDTALNDLIVRGRGKVIELSVYGDGNIISRFNGDGIIIATPTGSTGYSMSAGGPILEPSAKNILVTPVCAHVLISKPYVLVPERVVTVEVGQSKPNPAYISIDGKEHTRIFGGDIIKIKKSDCEIKIAHVTGRNFYRRVSEKLGEWA